MVDEASLGGWRGALTGALDEAVGKSHRTDPQLAGTGGPAGNARLTAWAGLILLALFLAELVTLLDVHQFISWHVVIGALLLPPALIKTASTGWRILRYYAGNRAYRTAGPPPMPLRLLGPLVIVATLGLLASGIVLVALGPDTAQRAVFTLVGQRVDWVTVHQGLFIVWGVVTGLHVLGRLLPAIGLAVTRPAAGERVDGRLPRALALVVTTGLAAVTAALLLSAASGWRNGDWGFSGHGGFDGRFSGHAAGIDTR